MKKILIATLFNLIGFLLFSQNGSRQAPFSTDCNSDFWTITIDGYIQQWSLNSAVITGGDTVLSGGGTSIGFCGNRFSPTFFTNHSNQGGIGINYYDSDSGWTSIPITHFVQDNGGHLNDQYYTVVGGVIQYVNYWDGTNLLVIDSLHGEFFAGVFDIGVDTLGNAWIFTASFLGTQIDSLKVYDPNGKIRSYSFPYDLHAYGSFFLNNTLYIGTFKDSIFPVLINGNNAQLGMGIPFSSQNFTDMASCQSTGTNLSNIDHTSPKIKLYPNPTKGYLRLPFEAKGSNIVVYNSIGQEIKWTIDGNILNLSEQPSGVYYIHFNQNRLPHYSIIIKH